MLLELLLLEFEQLVELLLMFVLPLGLQQVLPLGLQQVFVLLPELVLEGKYLQKLTPVFPTNR